MAMHSGTFRATKEKAKRLISETHNPGYRNLLEGYIQGLKRFQDGDAYGTLKLHRERLEMADSPDRLKMMRGMGYYAGSIGTNILQLEYYMKGMTDKNYSEDLPTRNTQDKRQGRPDAEHHREEARASLSQ